MTEAEPEDEPSTALTRSVGGSDLVSGLATVADLGIDAVVTAAHGIPVLGLIVGAGKATIEVRQRLQFNKVVRFLQGVSEASPEARAEFTADLAEKGKMEEFGENLLLLLDRLDDTTKPGIIGRVMAAHINGHIAYDVAMRLCAMVSRCYSMDMQRLKDFTPGVQLGSQEIAAMLAADGLLVNTGMEGGTIDGTGKEYFGTLYELSEYAHLLLKYGLQPSHS